MASLLSNEEDVSIKIPSSTQQDNVTFYNIEMKVGPVQWTVKHRYSEFAELHDVLVQEHCVEKDILPPKKLIGNKNEAFVEKRKFQLESYLNSVYCYLKKAMPMELAVFLQLHIYDIHFLLQNMALKFYTDPPTTNYYTFNPVQVILHKNYFILKIFKNLILQKFKNYFCFNLKMFVLLYFLIFILLFSVVRYKQKIKTTLFVTGTDRQKIRLQSRDGFHFKTTGINNQRTSASLWLQQSANFKPGHWVVKF